MADFHITAATAAHTTAYYSTGWCSVTQPFGIHKYLHIQCPKKWRLMQSQISGTVVSPLQ